MRATGANFTHVAEISEIEILRTPFKAPKANACCERFLGSVRRECLDHVLVLNERHLHRVIKEFVEYYNSARPHQGIDQAVPVPSVPRVDEPPEALTAPTGANGKVISLPVLGGLHHDYRMAA